MPTKSRSKPRRMSGLAALLISLPAICACSELGVVEERVTNDDGITRVCGEGDGLQACRDSNGETYAEEIKGPDIDTESTDELAAEVSRVRHETPEQLNQTISEMEKEKVKNSNSHATEGLSN